MNKIARIGIVAGLVVLVGVVITVKETKRGSGESTTAESSGLPRLVDLGADKCVPCKLMAPILEELKAEYAGRLEVVFIDVWKNPAAGKDYGVQLIPTQIFYDASGKELFRHQGFFSKENILAQWKELGVDLPSAPLAFSRLAPAQVDTRAAQEVCYLCDGDVDPKTRVLVGSDAGDVFLCSPHCYFITFTSLKEKEGLEAKVRTTDWTSGNALVAADTVYVSSLAPESGRPIVKAFADRSAAATELRESGGSLLSWEALKSKELAHRCGFCDRAVYPEDASAVRVGGLHTWGCCPMCALGVAARMRTDIEARVKDALTGEEIVVTTLDGSLRSIEPPTSVAWAGARKKDDGTIASTGCFKQAFFANEANLKRWVEAHPTATGRQITIGEALASKMKMTPEQIAGACKIGECKPR